MARASPSPLGFTASPPTPSPTVGSGPGGNSGNPASNPADRSESVDAEKSERAAQLFKLVSGLPEDQRRVIDMRFAEEKSIREIAQTLGRTPGAVKQLQFRGIQSLRAQFEKEPVKKLSRSHG